MTASEPAGGERAERPTAVTVTGVAWLIVGVLRFLGGLIGLIVWRLGGLQDVARRPDAFSTVGPATAISAAFKNLAVAVTGQMLVGIAIAFCAVGLLRLRPWARPAVEALCWLGLIFSACFGAVWVYVRIRVAMAGGIGGPPSVSRLVLGAVLLLATLLATAFILMIRALRRPDVRAVFRKS